MENRGGKRKGAGRKPCSDKKQTITLYIEKSKIKVMKGKENTRRKLYDLFNEHIEKLKS